MTSSTNNIEWIVLKPHELPASAQEFQQAFNAEVIGQEQAQAIALNAHERAHNPLRDPTKPIAIYVLIGPSRTGKTRTAKTTAKITHKDENALTVIEAGDYMERHQMLDLTGATPTYVGYVRPDEVRRLAPTEVDGTSKISAHNLRRVRLNSDSDIDIVCINEFEKGTPDFFNFWMGVWDNGFAIHGNGMKTDYRNTIFFVTMNLAMDEVEKLKRPGIGFGSRATVATADAIKEIVDAAMARRWPPEFINRLTKVVIFRPLTAEEILLICGLELDSVQTRINKQLGKGAFTLDVGPQARQWLVDESFKDNGDVAQLKRVVEQKIADVLGREHHKGTLRGVQTVRVTVSEDGTALVFQSGRQLIATPEAGASAKDTLPYRLQQARNALAHGDVPRRFFKVWLMTNSQDEANRFEKDLVQILVEWYGLTPISEYRHRAEPFIVSKVVHTSLDAVMLVKEIFLPHYPSVQIQEETK